jgi:DNA polymerase III subunit delta
LTPFGLTIEPGARIALIARLGADRALSRAEIEKLALYALDRKTITEDDVDAIVGDAADLQLERIAEAAAAGRANAAITDLGRALASGDDAQAVILITQRYFMKLHRVRAEIEQGARLDDALRSLRPPLHFKQRDAFSSLVRHWTTTSLNAALLRIGEAAQAARLSVTLDDTLSERLILALAAMAKAHGQRTGTGR